jgi:hypothetical protein
LRRESQGAQEGTAHAPGVAKTGRLSNLLKDASLRSMAALAVSTLKRSTAFAGVVPISAAKARAKCRGLMAAWSENYDCPPGRRWWTTSCLRGVARDLGVEVVFNEGEREIDTDRDAGRRPHVAVADEDAIGIEGHLRIPTPEMIRAAPVRGVVARRPSSRPASPRRNAPEQTLAMRRPFTRPSQLASSSGAAGERAISPPDTMIVSGSHA